jgi:hypothetical protein
MSSARSWCLKYYLRTLQLDIPDCCICDHCDAACCKEKLVDCPKCGFKETEYPLYRAGALAGLPITGDIVLPAAYATLVRREHRKCAPLCPTYLGFREWPAGASESDKRLLIAHANARQWKPIT